MEKRKKKELSKRNKDAIENYMNTIKQKYDKRNTLKNHKYTISRMLTVIDSDYDKIKSDDILKYLNQYKSSSAEAIKHPIIQFFKFYDMNGLAESIPRNPKALGKQTKGNESVLSQQDIEKIVNAPRTLMDRALLEIFVVTGARRNEILNLNIGDIKVEPDTIWIDVRESKTKRRRLPVIPNLDNPVARYPKYLIQWLKFREGAKPNEPLFLSISKGRIRETAIHEKFKWINEKVDIDSHVTPHILRHTGATYDGKYLTDTMLCQKYGWAIGSTMAKRYVHANTEQLAHVLMKQAGLKEDEVKKGKSCPRCGESNNINAEICVKCQQILDPKKLIEQVNKQDKEKVEQKNQIKLLQTEMKKMKEQFESREHFEGLDFHYILKDRDMKIQQLEQKIEDILRAISTMGKHKSETK